jgi:hypothetical protein
MKRKENLSIKNILGIINSCQTQEQLKLCKNLVDQYIKSIKRRGIVNMNDIYDRFNDELIQRQETIYLSDTFEL